MNDVIDLSALAEIFGDNQILISGALRQFKDAAAADLATLEAAFAHANFEAIEISAHRLHGAALIVGAGVVAAHSLTVERAARSHDLGAVKAGLPTLVRAVADAARFIGGK